MKQNLQVREDMRSYLGDHDVFAQAMNLQGDVYRQAPGRRTLRFEVDGHAYFAKIHQGVGWTEILKNLLTLRLPIIGARTEWRAIMHLTELGVPTMKVAAFGERGVNPAQRESFLITDEIAPSISLETYCEQWSSDRPPRHYRWQLIRAVADIARRMHGSGMCHRDFYLCHFLLSCRQDGSVATDAAPVLSVIDLHRALIRPALSRRWIVKDIAGLYFSSEPAGLSRTDCFRFIRDYTGQSPAKALREDADFWRQVIIKAGRVARRDRLKPLRRMVSTLYRDGPDIARQQDFGRVALFHRSDDCAALQQFIADPDAAIADGKLLKDGDSTTVVRLPWGGKTCVVKRYNLRNPGYLLRRLFRPSRAWYCWRNAHWLQQMGLNTPRPVLMLEHRWGPLRGVAYFVTEISEGTDVLSMLSQDVECEVWTEVLRQFRRLFATMKQYRMIHGDMKASNFLYHQDEQGGKLITLDLDAMRREGLATRFHRYFERDVERFLANWRDKPTEQQAVRSQLGASITLNKAD
ncbi:MAG: lipopolysaccharide core heptose(I) kinase RfaP [Pseudomonadota bacterium]|nr:lipopolysaccharide core heptose(I) kinase RfaP [Pseudomonadota bacterium]